MTRELGVQFARQGIRVNALCPGPVNTPLLQGAVREGSGARAAPAHPRARRPVRRARGTRRRCRVPRERRRVVHHRIHLPRRRRHQRRLRDSALISDANDRGAGTRQCGGASSTRRRLPTGAQRQLARRHRRAPHADDPARGRRAGAGAAVGARARRALLGQPRHRARGDPRTRRCRLPRSPPRPLRRHLRRRSAARPPPDPARRSRRRDRRCPGPARDPRGRGGACRGGPHPRRRGARAALGPPGRGRPPGPRDYRRLDSRLHLAFAEIVGVPSLVTLLADNRHASTNCSTRFPLLAAQHRALQPPARAIVLAILAGERRARPTAMREHLDGSAVLLRGFLA